MSRVAVIGAGSWGTALAQTLATAGNEVVMWARKPEVARAITHDHRNPRYLSEVRLSDSISATHDLAACVADAAAVVVVVPSRLIREFAQRLAPLVDSACPIVICSKGVEEDTALLPVQVFEGVVGAPARLAALSGPNHAEEVIRAIPSGTVIASSDKATAEFFRDLFSTATFRCYTSDDVVGVELCAAFKNVVAIGVGASYGAGMGDNTAAMLMTRGMAEMSRLVTACGGQAMTVMGLAGAGDLIATCTSEHSRNRAFGKLLAQGGTLAQFEKETHMVVEGALACKTILPLAQAHQVELPITQGVRDLVWDGVTVQELAQRLFSRSPKPEFWGISC